MCVRFQSPSEQINTVSVSSFADPYNNAGSSQAGSTEPIQWTKKSLISSNSSSSSKNQPKKSVHCHRPSQQFRQLEGRKHGVDAVDPEVGARGVVLAPTVGQLGGGLAAVDWGAVNVQQTHTTRLQLSRCTVRLQDSMSEGQGRLFRLWEKNAAEICECESAGPGENYKQHIPVFYFWVCVATNN